jgi:hypothetical protein
MILNRGTNRNTNSTVITKLHNCLKVIGFLQNKKVPIYSILANRLILISTISGIIKYPNDCHFFETQNNHEFVGLLVYRLMNYIKHY